MGNTIDTQTSYGQKPTFGGTLTQQLGGSDAIGRDDSVITLARKPKKKISKKPNKKALNRPVSKNLGSQVANFRPNEVKKVKAEEVAPGGEYEIQKEDNLYKLAKIWGCTVDDILNANPQIDPKTKKIYERKILKRPDTNAAQAAEKSQNVDSKQDKDAVKKSENEKVEDFYDKDGIKVKSKEVTADGTRLTFFRNDGYPLDTPIVAEFDKDGKIINCAGLNEKALKEFADLGKEYKDMYPNVTAKDLKKQVRGFSLNDKTVKMAMALLQKADAKDIGKILDQYYNADVKYNMGQRVVGSIIGLIGFVVSSILIPFAALGDSDEACRHLGRGDRYADCVESIDNKEDRLLKFWKESFKTIFSVFTGNMYGDNGTHFSLFHDIEGEIGMKEKDVNNIAKLAFSKYLSTKNPDNLTERDVFTAKELSKGYTNVAYTICEMYYK